MFPHTSAFLRQGHASESSVNSSVIRRPNPNRATIDRPCKLAYEGIPPRPTDNSCRSWHASFLFYMMKGVLPSSVVGPRRSPHPLQSVLWNRGRVKMSSSSMFDIKPINDPSSHDEIILFLVSQREAKRAIRCFPNCSTERVLLPERALRQGPRPLPAWILVSSDKSAINAQGSQPSPFRPPGCPPSRRTYRAS